MRVALLSAVWGRLPLTEVWWQGVDRMRAAFRAADIDFTVLVAGSEPAHRALCETWRGFWVEAPNIPLGAKWNACSRAAEGAHYVLVAGSDDFFSPALVARLIRAAKIGAPYSGIRGIRFYDLATHRACIFPGYPAGHRSVGRPLGAGRLLRADVCDALHWELWEASRNHALDRSTDRKLGQRWPIAFLDTPDAWAVDVKSNTNIWSYDRLAMVHPHERTLDPADLAALPEWPALQALRGCPARAASPYSPAQEVSDG